MRGKIATKGLWPMSRPVSGYHRIGVPMGKQPSTSW